MQTNKLTDVTEVLNRLRVHVNHSEVLSFGPDGDMMMDTGRLALQLLELLNKACDDLLPTADYQGQRLMKTLALFKLLVWINFPGCLIKESDDPMKVLETYHRLCDARKIAFLRMWDDRELVKELRGTS